jgi:hypothetical protein
MLRFPKRQSLVLGAMHGGERRERSSLAASPNFSAVNWRAFRAEQV